jgi:hypothetical protein
MNIIVFAVIFVADDKMILTGRCDVVVVGKLFSVIDRFIIGSFKATE